MDRLLRVDMTNLTVKDEPLPREWGLLGGRALSAKILLKEVDPRCDPLGPDNKVVFSAGALSGSTAPTSGRMSVGGKSPLTGGIKEANSGGQAGQKLARLGYRALILEGKARDPGRRYLVVVNRGGAEIRECPELKGLRTYAACEKLYDRFSKRAAFVLCGPAGELGLTGASVALTDEGHRYPTRHAARGGLGAAMGMKGLKAIVVDDEGTTARGAADAKGLKEFITRFSKAYKDGPQIFQFGTSSTVPVANMMHTFPTRNRRAMQFDGVHSLDGARIIENFSSRGGGMHHCMTGCIVQCSNVVHGPDGRYVTSALEFETLGLCGSNCEIADLDKVARIDRLCDDLGLDTIETGGALALAMDCGALGFGDGDAAIALLDRVDKETSWPRRSAAASSRSRSASAGASAIRRQGIPAWEPRTLSRTGITYATRGDGRRSHGGLVIGSSRISPEPRRRRSCSPRSVTRRFLPLPAADHRRDARVLHPHVRHRSELRRHGEHRLAVHAGRVGVQPARRLRTGGQRSSRVDADRGRAFQRRRVRGDEGGAAPGLRAHADLGRAPREEGDRVRAGLPFRLPPS
jgi:aldehyde:ferredoxin oxidoreductase